VTYSKMLCLSLGFGKSVSVKGYSQNVARLYTFCLLSNQYIKSNPPQMKKSIIVLSFFIILFSCSDDSIIREQENHSSVEHARKWFEQNIFISSTTSTNGRISSRPKSVSWEVGKSYVKNKTATVEVPIQYETELTAYPQGIAKNASYRNSTKMLMLMTVKVVTMFLLCGQCQTCQAYLS
jgi:hypothetical protein